MTTLHKSDVQFILDEMLADSSDWNVIINDDGMNIAVFDVKSVPASEPNYHKSLKIYFAPGLSPDDGQDTKEVEKLISVTVKAMGTAFRHMLDTAKDTKERLVKIYCDHPYKQLIFNGFASSLISKHPNLYKGKLYGKWVEIQHI